MSDIEWENATIEDHIAVANELGSASVDSVAECENIDLDMTDEEGSALFLAVAQREAPGAVGYFESILSMTVSLYGKEVTGDCLTDLATLETIIDEGTPMIELPLAEQWLVLQLTGSINYCSLQTQGEFYFREEVQEFFAGFEHLGG